MYNELSEVDIRKMQEEIDHILREVRPKCVDDLKTARGFGDLSENAEYDAAKKEEARVYGRLNELEELLAGRRIFRPANMEQIGS